MQLRFVARNGRKILQQAVAGRGRLTMWQDVPFVMLEEDSENVTISKAENEEPPVSFGIVLWHGDDEDK